ncbi:zinc-binding alcohol dehydrogenase family protein [Pandoraea sp. ISTKB]|uniref:quinone oxidoreductase family protein n=1 Tax=Pandoraea sp. ISTKB TaxID=1586708 RepID=UPI0008479981|nr:zinc-binding alcohol dehydrogenase family protein [Pandoraea sp. ISTKB]ODP32170.1 NADP-dependent oxidoreductase [Pandoraea sp. ISTKB]
MKAAVYYVNGGPEVFRFESVDDPVCGPDDVVIDIQAISLEGGDLINREIRPLARVPHIVGYQCAGVVSEVGAHVRNRQVGQRVVAVLAWGSHAERVAAPAADTWVVPDALDLMAAAAIPVAWGTAHECLFHTGGLQAGQTVLVHAGAGALGLAAIQLASAAGATVYATASSDERLSRLTPFGMSAGINYAADDFVARVKTLTGGRGVDLIVDSIAGTTLVRGVEALAYGGRIVTVGVSGRDTTRLDPVSLWRGNQSVHGVYFPTRLDHEHDRVHAVVDALIRRVADGELKVVIDQTFPLDQAQIAHAYVQSRKAFGRVMMTP